MMGLFTCSNTVQAMIICILIMKGLVSLLVAIFLFLFFLIEGCPSSRHIRFLPPLIFLSLPSPKKEEIASPREEKNFWMLYLMSAGRGDRIASPNPDQGCGDGRKRRREVRRIVGVICCGVLSTYV